MTYKFIFKQKLNGNDVVNVFNYEDDGVPTAITAGQLCQAIIDEWIAELVPFLAPNWSMESVLWTHSGAPFGQPAQPLTLNGVPFVGTASGFATANQVAMYVNAITIGGPPWRGGTYLGGWNSSLVGDDGLISQNRVDAALAFFDNIKTLPAVGIGNVARVIVSSKSKHIPAGTTALVNTHVVQRIPSTLDKRKIGTGS